MGAATPSGHGSCIATYTPPAGSPLPAPMCSTLSRRPSPLPPLTRLKSKESSMRLFAYGPARFLKSEDGPTAVGYAVTLALVLALRIIAVTALGGGASN